MWVVVLGSPEVEMALKGVQFIAQHIRNKDKDIEVNFTIPHAFRNNYQVKIRWVY